MGFMKPKTPAPPPPPVAPVPTADSLTAQQLVTQKTAKEQEADVIAKKKKQLKAGKSSLTVGLNTSTNLNTGVSDKQSGLSVGGA